MVDCYADSSRKMRTPRVFLSYSHDSPKHMDHTLALCDRLRNGGIDADLDQYETSPPQGWPQWMLDQIEGADFVCVVCTEIYNRRVRGKELPGIGLGARWEGAIITQELYEAERNEKYIALVFRTADLPYIPSFLRRSAYYDLSSSEGYDQLYRHLTDQPATPKPLLGSLKSLPPKPRQQFFVTEDADALTNATGKELSRPSSDSMRVSGTRASPWKKKPYLKWLTSVAILIAVLFLGMAVEHLRTNQQELSKSTRGDTAQKGQTPTTAVNPINPSSETSDEGQGPTRDRNEHTTKTKSSGRQGAPISTPRVKQSIGFEPTLSNVNAPSGKIPSSGNGVSTKNEPSSKDTGPISTPLSTSTGTSEIASPPTGASPQPVAPVNAATNANYLSVFVETVDRPEVQNLLNDIKKRCLSTAPFMVATDWRTADARLSYAGSHAPNQLLLSFRSTDGKLSWDYPLFRERISGTWQLDFKQASKDICDDFLLIKAESILNSVGKKRD